MKRVALLLIVAVTCSNFISSANAATAKTSISFAVASTPNAGESLVTFYGQVKPAAKGSVTISSFDGVTWKVTPLKTTSTSSGSWKITTVATAIKAEGQYKATVTVGKKKTLYCGLMLQRLNESAQHELLQQRQCQPKQPRSAERQQNHR